VKALRRSLLARRTALVGLYRLRATSHVIDKHQLTKTRPCSWGASADSSPPRDLSRDQPLRYLDYCAEMLSFIGSSWRSACKARPIRDRQRDRTVDDIVKDEVAAG
jgi:hypothetical protein